MFVYITVTYLILSNTIIHETLSAVAIIDKGVMNIEQGSIGLQLFVDIENDHHSDTCRIYSWPKVCCLENNPYKDCCTDSIYGDSIAPLMPKRRDTLVYVYPTLYPYDQIGYCDFVIEYKCSRQQRYTRLDINIPFNTDMARNKNTKHLKGYYQNKPKVCDSLDEDALHDCLPVNCDLKYSGRRPFFDPMCRKCVNAPECETNLTGNLPDVAYVPDSNTCRNLDECITLGDIYGISTGLGVICEPTKSTLNQMMVEVKTNCSTISQNIALLKELLSGKLCPLYKGDTSAYDVCWRQAILAICGYIMAVSALLLSFICCIHTTAWFYQKWTSGNLRYSLDNLKHKMSCGSKNMRPKPSGLRRDLTNNLLKEVLTRDLPLEMRDSVVEICERIGREVKKKKRYRMVDLGSQINLLEDDSFSSTANSSVHDNDK